MLFLAIYDKNMEKILYISLLLLLLLLLLLVVVVLVLSPIANCKNQTSLSLLLFDVAVEYDVVVGSVVSHC